MSKVLTVIALFGAVLFGTATHAQAPPTLPQGNTGIAQGYPNDAGISGDARVLFFDGFESYTSASQLVSSGNYSNSYQGSNLLIDTAQDFLGTKSLRMRMPSTGSEVSNAIVRPVSPSRDSLYFRVYARYQPTFGGVGNGHSGLRITGNYGGPGVIPDGTDFFAVVIENSRYLGEAEPGYTNAYVYHPEQDDLFGEHWYPDGQVGNGAQNFGAFFVARPKVVPARGQWISFETLIQMNTPGLRDGRVAVWQDGVLIADWQNIRFRDVSTVKIDEIQLENGGQNSSQINDKWYDNLVLATSYIGPVSVTIPPIAAASCSSGDVQTALNQAVAGSTVTIPAGTCNWSTPVSWNAPANVTVLGAGNLTVVGGGNATNIVDNYASESPLFTVNTNAAGAFRLAGVTFRGGNGQVKWGGMVNISGSSQAFRVDHVHVNMQTYSPSNNGAAMRVIGDLAGVIDHSIFSLDSVGNGIAIWDTGDGDASWNQATGLGTASWVFIEDNQFNANSRFGAANDCTAGGRWVFRYNILNGAMVQTHPTGGGQRHRGCRAWEIYNNTFTWTSADSQFNGFFMSAGTGVMWGNSTTGVKHVISLHSMRRNNATYGQSPTPGGWGYCGTTQTGTGSNWDENTVTSTGYACMDQPGRGFGDLLANDFPNVTNVTRGCTPSQACAWPRQALEPAYEWLNTWNCSGCGGGFVNVSESEVLAANRDYYLWTGSFTGATGVGSGTLAARPSTCTTGVAYWATNTNTLYRCTATNVWTTYYQPYTYPHPLIAGAPPPSVLPNPPTNVILTQLPPYRH